MKNLFSISNKFAPAYFVAIFSIITSFITRTLILILFGKNMSVSFPFVGSFFIGMLYDIVVSSFIIIPFVLQIVFTNNFIYTKNGRLLTILFFIALLFTLFFTNLFPKDYNKDLYKVLEYYVIFRFAIYLFLCFQSPDFRKKWRTFILLFLIFIAVFLLLFNVISEIVFWQEFSGRYNFIAVDYLVYTHEVIGNIRESYPVTTIITSVTLVTLIVLIILRKRVRNAVWLVANWKRRIVYALVLLSIPAIFLFTIKPVWASFSSNNYANELAGNGIYQFIQAFQNNELDFYKFYKTIPDDEAFAIVRKELGISGTETRTIERDVKAILPERRMNVVLISVESLSADFMSAFGNTKSITPQLDSLAAHSLFFTKTYASGTRTVRGLEALSLSIPPTPGQSIVKRPENENLFSLGSVFKSKGYITQFIYGGYAYFDNMSYFFSHNNYDVIDRSAIKPADIHYANIWGVADEDLFNMALLRMDENYQTGKPFFSQVMTVSNHRPFTYPENRIDIPSSNQSREGGVKYTDFAIGNFIKQAAEKPWFKNTLFVVVADHCASSAGSAYLPVTGYHIPLLIFAPSLLEPKKIDKLTAQIDIPPTILGLLNFSYKSKFFGVDVLDSTNISERAFISTYQGLGFLENNKLVIQSPLKKINMFQPDFTNGKSLKIKSVDSLERKAIAFYQVAAWLIKNNKYSALSEK